MQNVILIVHLILALCLIGIVLLQRSEGGGLGMGSASGGGVMSGRAAATALGKLTWLFAIAFICTSVTLTILAAANSSDSSVVDRIADTPEPVTAPEQSTPDAGSLLPPPPTGNEPLVPQAAD